MWSYRLLFLLAGQVCIPGSPARCPLVWPGDTRQISQLADVKICPSGVLTSPYNSPPPIHATAGTSSIHANRVIWLKPSFTSDHPSWSLWYSFPCMCATEQGIGQLIRGCGGTTQRWVPGQGMFPITASLSLGRNRSPALLQALPTSSCSAAGAGFTAPPFPASQYV